MCVKGRNPEVPGTGSQTSRTEPPAVRNPGCQRRPDAVRLRLSVAAAVSRSGIMATGRNDLRGFQPDRRVRKLRTFPARPRPDRAGNRCGPPVRPPSHAFQVMRIMINKISMIFETIIYTPCSLDLKIKNQNLYLFISLNPLRKEHTSIRFLPDNCTSRSSRRKSAVLT